MKHLFAFALCLFVLSASSQYQNLLWKISGNGLAKESFLFGTMHSADNRAFKKTEQVKKAIKQCDAYAMEILADENELDASILLNLMMKDGTTLSKLFSKEEYHTLDSLLEESIGYSIELLENIQPIVVSLLLEQAGAAKDSAEPLDLYLQEFAENEGKKLIGIETVQEQLKALQALSYKEQAQMVKEDLKKQNNLELSEQLFRFYVTENLDSMVILNKQNPMPEKLEKALITDRNKIMIERITAFIKQQPTFCAVGALHLPEKNGIIEGLRKKGFKVEAVK
jgi:uncharacterized protein YbaP (TraB family)